MGKWKHTDQENKWNKTQVKRLYITVWAPHAHKHTKLPTINFLTGCNYLILEIKSRYANYEKWLINIVYRFAATAGLCAHYARYAFSSSLPFAPVAISVRMLNAQHSPKSGNDDVCCYACLACNSLPIFAREFSIQANDRLNDDANNQTHSKSAKRNENYLRCALHFVWLIYSLVTMHPIFKCLSLSLFLSLTHT